MSLGSLVTATPEKECVLTLSPASMGPENRGAVSLLMSAIAFIHG